MEKLLNAKSILFVAGKHSMQIIDKEGTKLLFSQRGLLDPTGEPFFAQFVEVMNFTIPADSGRKTALSKTIASFFETDDEALLWINEFGIWKSSEDQYLFNGFRRFLGENSPLHEKPGHIFSKEDLDAVRSLVAMILYFVWGAILFSPTKDLAIKISHDEYLSVFAKRQENASKIINELKLFV